MPPTRLPHCYRVHISPRAIAAAAAAQQARVSGAWHTAYGKAAAIVSAHPRCVHIAAGQFYITSPRSGRVYQTSADSCSCEAHGVCWHLALVRLLRTIWAQHRPVYRCTYCGGPMVASRSYAGERVFACCCCEHEVMFGCADTLVPWGAARAEAA